MPGDFGQFEGHLTTFGFSPISNMPPWAHLWAWPAKALDWQVNRSLLDLTKLLMEVNNSEFSTRLLGNLVQILVQINGLIIRGIPPPGHQFVRGRFSAHLKYEDFNELYQRTISYHQNWPNNINLTEPQWCMWSFRSPTTSWIYKYSGMTRLS